MLNIIFTFIATCLAYLIIGSVAFKDTPSIIGSILFAAIATPFVGASIQLFRWTLTVDKWGGWFKVFFAVCGLGLGAFGLYVTSMMYALGNSIWSFGGEDYKVDMYAVVYVYIAAFVPAFGIDRYFSNNRKISEI